MTTIRRKGDVDYDNYAPLIEVVANFHLPNGRTRDLRVLVDCGATDNFIHEKVVREFSLSSQALTGSPTVSLGSEGSEATAQGESEPLTMTSGRMCKHRSRYTILNIGEYDVILGRPFLKFMGAKVEGDNCLVPSRRGWQSLPVWASEPTGKTKLVRLSRTEMARELRNCKKEEALILIPSGRILSFLEKNTEKSENSKQLQKNQDNSKTDYSNTHKDPAIQARLWADSQTKKQKDSTQNGRNKSNPNLPPVQKSTSGNGLDKGTSDPLQGISFDGDIPGLRELLEEFADVFPADLPAELPPEREFEMKIPVKPGSTPPSQAPYRISAQAWEAIKATLQYLYSHGLARDSLSDYAAPVTLAPKSDGTWRFCTDYRRLNAVTQEAKYPLPRIEDCLDQLGKARYYSKIDLRSGYWQVRIKEEDIPKTAFRTPFGHHEWLVMPFGLQGAPSTFQRMMNHYLRDYLGDFVLCYLDDVLIYSNTREEHLTHIRKVLEVLRTRKLYAKGTKCEFFRKEVQFLGFQVRGGTVDKDPAKVAAVQDWPVPTTVREVRSFLGLAGFYRKFVKDFAKIAKPLTDILKSTQFEEKYGAPFKKQAPVTLGPAEVSAFKALKEALTSAPCLVIFDPTKPTEVWADASWSHSTIGAVLLQDHGKGMQPVAFLSRVMNGPESRYPTFEQELLALKIAMEEWRHYLLPIHFVARTDHNGLKFLQTQKHLRERQWHWLAFFSEYQFDLVYRPGKQMTVPDALSRKPKTESDIETLLRIQKRPDDEPFMEINVQTSSGRIEKVLMTFRSEPKIRVWTHKRAVPSDKATIASEEIPEVFDYAGDPDYGEIFKKLSSQTKYPEEPSLQLYAIRGDALVWLDGKQRPRVCVPKKYRASLLHEYHDTPLGAHFGGDKTYHTLRQTYIWPHMRHHVETYVRSCDACQKNKASHRKKHGHPTLPDVPCEPWERMSVDFCGPFPLTKRGNDEVAGFICNLTREVVLVPCSKTITAKETAKLFVRHVMRVAGGIPKIINSDRGPQFVSHFWTYLWKTLKTTVALSAPYHPQSNSLIERQNATFIENLRSYVNALHDDWDEGLIYYEFAYNASVNPSTGETPFFLNHGRQPRLPTAMIHPTPSPAVNDFVTMLHNRIAAARDHVRVTQGRAADRRAPTFEPVTFTPGDLVLLNTEHYNLQLPSQKLAPRWIGPLKIEEIRGPNTVRIEVPPRLARIEPLQNVQHLKRYVTRPPDIGPTISPAGPDVVDDHDEYEVEEILAHRGSGSRAQYLVRFATYGPEDDLWLPARNLENAEEIVKAYHDRQRGQDTAPTQSRRSRAPRHLMRMGHVWVQKCQRDAIPISQTHTPVNHEDVVRSKRGRM